MNEKQAAMVRSALRSAGAALTVFLMVAAVPGVAIPAAWVGVGVTAFTVVATLIAWIDKGMPLYGRGSGPGA